MAIVIGRLERPAPLSPMAANILDGARERSFLTFLVDSDCLTRHVVFRRP